MTLPTELLLEITTIVFLDYLEDVMPDLALIRDFALEAPLPPNVTLEQIIGITAEQINEDKIPLAGPYDRNYLIPLLQTSYQVREATLSVLSNILCIPRLNGRLSSKPWSRIRQTMGLYANPANTSNDICIASNSSPMLHVYGAVAHLEWRAWLKVQAKQSSHLCKNILLSALGADMLTETGYCHAVHRVALSLVRNSFVPTIEQIRKLLGQLLPICSLVQAGNIPPSDDRFVKEEVERLITTLLQQIKEIWTQYPTLIAAFWRLGMTPVAAAEISAEVGIFSLYRMVAQIVQVASLTPELETCRRFAQDILDKEMFGC